MRVHKLLIAITEALTIYGLIIVAYGTLAIHVTKTWTGNWRIDNHLPWLTLDIFMMISFALSFFGYITWRYLKSIESTKQKE